MREFPPVLITAFLRPEKTKELVAQLISMGAQSIFLSVDKGRTSKEVQAQQLMLNEITSLQLDSNTKIQINQLKVNSGLAVAVISALDWFFSSVEFGVILEDDLIPTPQFFEYCNANRFVLEENSNCWLLSGNQFTELSDSVNHPILSHYPLIWGWATTSDKWRVMKNEVLNGTSVLTPKRINLVKFGFFHTGMLRARKGKIDSWAVPLSARMYMTGSTCLLPPFNLVSNQGDDSISTHSSNSDWMINHPVTHGDNFYLSYKPSGADFSADAEIEEKIYKIHTLNFLSPIASKLFDRSRFNIDRNSLSDRLSSLQEGGSSCVD